VRVVDRDAAEGTLGEDPSLKRRELRGVSRRTIGSLSADE
jgi:hypothetical protein